MKKLNLLLISVIITLLSFQVSESQEGAVYYFTLFPGLVQPSDTVAQVNLLTNINTEIKIERGINKLRENIKAIKNEFTSFNLTASEVQPVTKYDLSLGEHVIENAAIKITVLGSESANCVIRTKYGNNSDGMMIMDKSKLGNSYQITNSPNSEFRDSIETNFTAIIGIHDNTRVTFRMGGCVSCNAIKEDGSILKLNQTIRRTLNEGDVWLIPAYGQNSVLTGSTVNANKPVAVFSGSNNVVNTKHNGSIYDIIQEIPNELWGKSYLIPKFIYNEYEYPVVTVFAKYPYTNIYNNGVKQFTISTPGGTNNSGYMQFDTFYNLPKMNETNEITSDTSINVLITDTKSKITKPVQVQIIPTEQFSNTAVFKIENQFVEYINVIYKSTKDGEFPEDLLISEYKDGQLNWKNLLEYSTGIGYKYYKTYTDGSSYNTMNFRFLNSGTYFIKSGAPIGVYQFGISANTSSGFPVNGNFNVTNSQDTLAPTVEYSSCCLCNTINGKVTDQPTNNPEIRSNLGMVYIANEDSYNARFTYIGFIAGIDASLDWELRIIDQTLDMRAHLVFIDKAGNRRDTIIECAAPIPEISPLNTELGIFNINNGAITKNINFDVRRNSSMTIPANIEMYLILDSDSTEAKTGDINTNQHFDLGNMRDVNIYPLIANNQTLNFDIKFASDEVGKYKDSVGIIILSTNPLFIYAFQYFAELNALIGDNYIDAEDYDFGSLAIQNSKIQKIKISNPRKSGVETAFDLTIDKIEFNNSDIGFVGSGRPFEVDLPVNVSKENPLIIKPDDFYTFNVKFAPKEIREFKSEITFSADSELPDKITKISGSGFTTSVGEDHNISSKIDIISENGILKFKSETDETIDEIEIYDIMGKLVLSKKVNQILNGFTFETTNFTHNVYIIKMLINGNWISKKVII
jgi:hypothetical protein